MHVAHLSDVLPPGIGGVETALGTLFDAMPDVRFTVLASSASLRPSRRLPPNVTVRPLILQEIGRSVLGVFPARIRRNSGLLTYPLHEWERRQRVVLMSSDLVHMHSFSAFRYFANFSLRHPSVMARRLVDWLRDFEDYGPGLIFTDHSLFAGRRQQFDSIHGGLLVERLRHIVCVESTGKDNVEAFARENGLDVDARWIPNPIDTSRFFRGPTHSRQRLVIGYAGRFEKQGVDRVLGLIQEAPDWAEFHLALAGSDADRERAGAQLQGFPVRIEWNVPNESMPEFYNGIDLFVDPLGFGAPRTSLEALSCGRIVIRLRRPESMPGELPVEVSPVVDVSDPAGFFRRISSFRDRETLSRGGDASRRLAEDQFSAVRVANEYRVAYRQVAKGH